MLACVFVDLGVLACELMRGVGADILAVRGGFAGRRAGGVHCHAETGVLGACGRLDAVWIDRGIPSYRNTQPGGGRERSF